MGLLGAAAVRDGGAALPHGFWAAVRVWLEKPQVANRRLCGAAIEAEGTVPPGEGGEAASAGAAELGRLWREVRGQLPAGHGHGHLPPPLTAWGGPGRRSELRAVLRTLLPRGRPGGPPAPPTKELAVQGEREARLRGAESGRDGERPPAPERGVCGPLSLSQACPLRGCLASEINSPFSLLVGVQMDFCPFSRDWTLSVLLFLC